MLNAHLTYFKVNYSLLTGKLSHQLNLLRGSNILTRHEMVRHHDYLFRVKDPFYPYSPKLSDSNRGSNIIGQN